MSISAEQIKRCAGECGFELAGITSASAPEDYGRFDRWRRSGMAAGMSYLTDRRGDMRSDLRTLLPSVWSVVCVGKLYNTGDSELTGDQGRIARYACGEDYHVVLRRGLKQLVRQITLLHPEPFESRICVDTAPLLERSVARDAGLGWIGKNTCLINQAGGSWFFLGELLLSIPLAPDTPPPDRCGTCRRCIDACPTAALAPDPEGRYALDSRLCISYLTIEHHGVLPNGAAASLGNHLFGCDICQDVCPWNREADVTGDPAFQPMNTPARLTELAAYSEDDFARTFRQTPVWRTRYSGFLRNVAAAMGNAGGGEMREPLTRLAASTDPTVAAAAREALER